MAKRGHYTPRVTAYADVAQLDVPPLSAILAGLAPDVRQVYLVGPRPGDGTAKGMYAWLGEPAVAEEWSTDGSHLDPDTPTLRLTHRETERRVEVRRAAQWFGEGLYTVDDARGALALLQARIQDGWPGAAVLSTPAVTGRALFDLSTPAGTSYEPLDDDTRALIARTSGQGRIELCGVADTAPGFYYLDGRFMYAALCKELPGALTSHDTGDELVPYQRARYRVRFTVPADWAHVGLFMVPVEGTRDRWHYPAAPGSTWETWADGVEVELARSHGWDVAIVERLIFSTARPLDTWARKLIDLRGQIGDAGDTITDLARAGLRNILLHTIGGFARRERTATRLVSTADLARVEGVLESAPSQVRPGVWLVEEREELPARLAVYQHPEWAAAIWARARSRLLWSRVQCAGALAVPRADVLGFQVDALYLAHDPGWPDKGTPGHFRCKGSVTREIATPRTWVQMEALKDRATGEGEVSHGA